MRRVASILVMVLAAWLAPAANAADDAPPVISCGNGVPGGVNCLPTRKELKLAGQAFRRVLKLEDRHQLEDAYDQFDQAARIFPQSREFLTAREMVKAQLVYHHMQRGNRLLSENSAESASAEFRAALHLDPDNQYAADRLAEATLQTAPAFQQETLAESSGTEIRVQPNHSLATFHYSGDIRGLFAELSAAFGVEAKFDESVQNHPMQFNVDDVDFDTALRLASQISKTMWVPLGPHQIYLAQDSPENHKQFDHMALEMFEMPPHANPQEVNEFISTLRTMFDLRFIQAGNTAGVLEIRAPARTLEACGQLLQQISGQRPQVMFDVRVYQIDHKFARDVGLHVPDTFNLYNIPAAALAGLGGQNIQDLINQLIASGGINQAGNSALSGLLAQLGGQGNSIFSQPLATFGGGLTFSGLSLDQLVATLSLNESWSRSLDSVTMRAGQGSDSTMHLGERFPIINASYAPIYNSSQISQVLGNQSYISPVPSVSYEDIGLSLKMVKPTIHANGDVSLQLELQVRSLTGQGENGVPVISNREYKGGIHLRDGEPAVIAGQISRSDTLSMSGLPGFGFLPGLSQLAASHTKEESDDELMIVITPHVLSNTLRQAPEIWLSEK